MNIKAQRHGNTGRFFKKKRLQVGITQKTVAKALNYTSTQMVSNWERGFCSPAGKKLKILMKLYKITKSELMTFLVSQAHDEYSYLLGDKVAAKKSTKKKQSAKKTTSKKVKRA